MNRELLEISDGKEYRMTDMPKVGCHDCAGCSACCRGMGDSILLDPFDLHMLMQNLNRTFQELLEGPVELHLEEGLVLPNLKMGEQDACTFLNEEGRCSIHAFRPGLCRAFPLGRNYETDETGKRSMSYFVLAHECPAEGRTKVKITKWLGIPQAKEYHEFLITWHALAARMREEVTADPGREEENRRNCMRFLQYFYAKPYESGDFFREFRSRADAVGII